MFRLTYFLLTACILLVVLASCRLTRKDVIGTWKGGLDDTIVINSDNSFLFIKDKFSKQNQNSFKDTTSSHLTGHWILYKAAIHFDFADTMKNFGGGCTTYQYWKIRSSKRKLIRPRTCRSPTHEFYSIIKVK